MSPSSRLGDSNIQTRGPLTVAALIRVFDFPLPNIQELDEHSPQFQRFYLVSAHLE